MKMSDQYPYFIPADSAGTRTDTAALLVGTAREFDVPQHDIKRTYDGYVITERLMNVLYDEGVYERPEDEKPKKKTSGNRAEKTDSKKKE